MPNKQLKVFGAFRTGSNLVRSLLELNFDVVVHNNNYAYKHIPVPANFEDNQYKPFPIGTISTAKDPFAFLDSAFRYCKKNNFLNIEAGETFDEFCYQRFIVFDGGFKGFPRYRFANPIQYWNSINQNLLSLPKEQNFVLRYEDLLEDMEDNINKIGEKFNLRRIEEEFILPTGLTINLGDPERSSSKDYFQNLKFERKNYYLERQYMERFTDSQKDFIYSELDHEIMQALSYPESSSVLETQANKTSFVSDLRHLVRLGEERIPQLEASLVLERETSLGLAQQLEQRGKKVLELESGILKESLARESLVSSYENKLKEENAAKIEETKWMHESLHSANDQIVDFGNKSKDLEGQLTEVRASVEDRDRRISERDNELKVLEGQLTEVRASVEDRDRRISERDNELKDLDSQLIDVREGLQEELKQLQSELKTNKGELNRAKVNYYGIRESFSFRLGHDLVNAIAKPGKNTLMLPFNVVKSFKSVKSGDSPTWKQKSVPDTIVKPQAQLENLQDDSSGPLNQNEVPETIAKPQKQLDNLQGDLTESLKRPEELKVACIFDEFTTGGYQDECKLLPVPLNGWLELFSVEKPDLLFVESAWRGNAGQWEYKIGKYAGQDGTELSSLIKWCNENKVPTVFWNKEDPVHFDKFIDSAKQFDVIFTTDDGKIPDYRQAVAHNKVFPLQFSAQPKLHNPVRITEVEDKICFAGSYYINIHETRRKEMNEILDIAKTYGLVIYDRNYERNFGSETEFSFPERFREYIEGSLKYSEMEKAYKGYRYCLNVNSIKDSSTMFSRRVFESLACGTPVLSTWSKGIEETFGDLILMTGQEFDAEQILKTLHEGNDAYAKMAIQGIRDVYDNHLYKHRFTTILKEAGIRVAHDSHLSVTMACIVRNVEEAERVILQFNNQTLKQKSLLLLLDFDEGVELFLDDYENKLSNITTFHLNSVLTLGYSIDELSSSTHIAFVNPTNYYGEYFLTDLVHAAIYTDAQVIGKASYFTLDNDETRVVESDEYRFTDSILNSSSIMDSNLFCGRLLEDVMNFFGDERVVGDLFKDPVKCFSINKFNFVESAYLNQRGTENNFSDQIDV